MRSLSLLILFLSVNALQLIAQLNLPSTMGSVEEFTRQYAAVDSSVVLLRTMAEMPLPEKRREAGDTIKKPPLVTFGTGVVIGTIAVEGRMEYLLLTNHHVADVSNYVIQDRYGIIRENRHNNRALPQLPEVSHIVEYQSETPDASDIKLIELSRHVRGDMTLLRTDGADRLFRVFEGEIGYVPDDVREGDWVVTSGFPHDDRKRRAVGRILETLRSHALGQAHQDFISSLSARHGQSGSPVFRIEIVPRSDGEIPRLRFRLIGLVHAVENGETFLVPFALWGEALESYRSHLGPRLAPAHGESRDLHILAEAKGSKR